MNDDVVTDTPPAPETNGSGPTATSVTPFPTDGGEQVVSPSEAPQGEPAPLAPAPEEAVSSPVADSLPMEAAEITSDGGGEESTEEPGAPEESVAEVEAEAPAFMEPVPPPSNKRWYVVKVQSGREESIKEAVERRVRIEGLEEFFGQVVIPVEKVVEMRNNKRITRERKLFPGYMMVEVEFNDRMLYLFRETSGVGDFVGAGINRAPVPMSAHEVERMLRKSGGKEGVEEPKEVTGKPPVERGDRVKVKDGTFAGMEGEVKDVIEAQGRVRIELVIFGRPVPVDLEYWQVEAV